MHSAQGTFGRVGLGVCLAMVGAGGLTACGDDDDTGSGDREQLVAAADAICERIDAEGERLSDEVYGPDFSRDPSLEEQAEFLRQLVINVDGGLDDIEALPGPADGKALLARVFEEDPFVDDARAAVALADAGDQAGFERALEALFDEGSDPDPELVEDAQAYGFRSCVPSGED